MLSMVFGPVIGPHRPVSWNFQFWPVLVFAIAAAFVATWVCNRIALKFGIVDKPDDLVKTHKEPIAYLGGIGMMAGFAVGVLAGLHLLQRNIPDTALFSQIMTRLWGILAGATIACVVGVVDDLFDLSPRKKLLGQLLAACMLILVGILPAIECTTQQFSFDLPKAIRYILEASLVVVFVLGATNSLNLLDGLDGLCGGVTAIITLALLLLSAHRVTWDSSEINDPIRMVVCLALLGGVCGFLPFNRYPAKIFMGDAGSMLLGFVVASVMLLFAESTPRWWLASIIVFGLPILDTATALARRFLNKRPLFVSDRGHIYDQMIDRGISLKKTVVICYFLAGLYAIIGLTMSQIRTRYAVFVYLAVVIVSAVVIWKKGYLKMEGLRGAIKAEQAKK